MLPRKYAALFTVFLIILLLPTTGLITAQENKDVTIAVIPPAMVSPFHVAITEGAKEQARKYGWDIIIQAPERETDLEGQVTMVERVVQQGVEAISVYPIIASAMIAGVRAANDAGIPMFMQNLITPIAEGDIVEYIGL